jgi:hypothetical protein
MKELIAICAVIILVIANIAALITAIVHDIATNQLLWVIIDCVFSPAGVIRGWLIWFGVV